MTTKSQSKPKLYSFWRSSAAFRVRIALNLKGIPYEIIPIHLTKNGGAQFNPDYSEKNPTHLLPLFEDNEISIHQSLAIIEYLEETHPTPPLLPASPRTALGFAH
jgi:maleylacetoacetate isomerase/maleylpyruvate isomerase